jgi:hypothetical protein
MTNYALFRLCAALAMCAGCAPVTLQAAYVPNPVLLGPVDRIGGHRATRDPALKTFAIEADGPTSTSKETTQVGGQPQVSRRMVGSMFGERAVTNALLGMTEGRSDRDVRVDEIPAGAYVWISFVGGVPIPMQARWVDASGGVVQVRHDR